MVCVKDILMWLDAGAPFRYAAGWDQCGLQIGDPDAMVERILVALDPSSETLREAVDRRCQCIVTHHPLIFRPITTVRFDKFPGNLIAYALKNGINLIAAHTNLDVARAGTNDRLVELLSLKDVVPLEVDAAWNGEERYVGMGRIGHLNEAVSLQELAERTSMVLGGVGCRIVGDPEKQIQRLAVCTGSGGSLLEDVIAASCDAYVTGDIKYHEAKRALEAGLALLDVGHFASERLIVQPLVDYLTSEAQSRQLQVEVFAADEEEDPFWTI
jgi:dinuclear metal center YbgI/SA1388 family protein